MVLEIAVSFFTVFVGREAKSVVRLFFWKSLAAKGPFCGVRFTAAPLDIKATTGKTDACSCVGMRPPSANGYSLSEKHQEEKARRDAQKSLS